MDKDFDRLKHFMNGLTAAAQLKQRAAENGFMVEVIILCASIIDGALRIGLVLQHQIETKSTEVPEDLVYQRDEDKVISEREIYRRALNAGVIKQALFDELQDLFTARNRVVHRYIISDITTEKVFKIAHRFEKAIELVNDAIWIVEDRQTQLGVGMARKTPRKAPKEDSLKEMDAMAKDKHGAEWLARILEKPRDTHMIRTGGQTWEISLLASWKSRSESACETIGRSNGVGVLQISAARRKSPVTDADLMNFAKGFLNADSKTKSVTFGDFTGFEIRYEKDNAHWRQWFLRNGTIALFVTYNSDVANKGKEDAEVDQMLATLVAKNSAP